ncbi:hypothetical protein RRU94_15830 [Domibacillus sp. DTU_2020_1001157_1_SI_ALB_TIR_016]|uniref:hypothetical protein n=1 Tax=Domibacillus sp. DTU_2020_1001157_1_SI_ALB_TIR_016 TaxID=3077789 RepID=UPI0028E9767D|nr:hypothetical protein [Domibacillus sp. DTU_2020_1001157_1_SI_ALB_TIR_016]WNS82212.1 hypothetical protein RRU94_15830 [Domibacillus sp. DTU_2020_1001157_1_SI_ALB_TIR_016]
MLAEEKVWINCQNNTKKYFVSKGYEWKKNEQILVTISDLPIQSNQKIKVQCDYCNEKGVITYCYPPYSHYNKSRQYIEKDACGNCASLKRKEVHEAMYGVSYPMQRKEVVDKFRKNFDSVKNLFEECGLELLASSVDYENADTWLPFKCLEHQNVEGQKTTYRTLYSIRTACRVCGKRNQIKYREDSHLWKGGVVPLSTYLRERINPWKKDSRAAWGWRCVLSGKKNNTEVHHLNRNFNSILQETLISTDLPLLEKISEYQEKDLLRIEEKCLELHYHYGLGIPLLRTIHKDYHSQYGKEDGDIHTFMEFAEKCYGVKGSLEEWVKLKLDFKKKPYGKYHHPKKVGKSRFSGVTFSKGKWSYALYFRGNAYRQQGYETEVEAAYAYNLKSLEIKGEYAKLNQLTEEEKRYAKNKGVKVLIPKGKRGRNSKNSSRHIQQKLDYYPLKKEGETRFTNVRFNQKNQSWMYDFRFKNKSFTKRGFENDVQAAYAYNLRVKEVKGEEAILNYLTEEERNLMEKFFMEQIGTLSGKKKSPVSRFRGLLNLSDQKGGQPN